MNANRTLRRFRMWLGGALALGLVGLSAQSAIAQYEGFNRPEHIRQFENNHGVRFARTKGGAEYSNRNGALRLGAEPVFLDHNGVKHPYSEINREHAKFRAFSGPEGGARGAGLHPETRNGATRIRDRRGDFYSVSRDGFFRNDRTRDVYRVEPDGRFVQVHSGQQAAPPAASAARPPTYVQDAATGNIFDAFSGRRVIPDQRSPTGFLIDYSAGGVAPPIAQGRIFRDPATSLLHDSQSGNQVRLDNANARGFSFVDGGRRVDPARFGFAQTSVAPTQPGQVGVLPPPPPAQPPAGPPPAVPQVVYSGLPPQPAPGQHPLQPPGGQ